MCFVVAALLYLGAHDAHSSASIALVGGRLIDGFGSHVHTYLLGSLSEGKSADIIAINGDVLRHIDLLQHVTMVIKHGVRYKGTGA